jgi:hypothetical protein
LNIARLAALFVIAGLVPGMTIEVEVNLADGR